MSKSDRGKIGRRPGQSKSRGQILLAAQKLFAGRGYDRTTIRSVALAAGVNPALVAYFFRTKQELFVEAVLPVYEPRQNLPQLLAGDPAGIGRRLATFFVNYLEDPESRRLVVGLVRACLSEPAAADMAKKLFVERIGDMLSRVDGVSNPAISANFVGTQFVGLVVLRYIVKAEPLASASKEAVVDVIAPTLQGYIAGETIRGRASCALGP